MSERAPYKSNLSGPESLLAAAVIDRDPRPHPGRAVAVIVLVGLILTAFSAWGVARVDHNSENRLLEGQSRQVATVLSTAIQLIEQPVKTALAAQVVTGDTDTSTFETLMADDVGPQQQFVSTSLWRQDQDELRELTSVGERPGMNADDPAMQQFLERALGASSTVVTRVAVGDGLRIAYAVADPTAGLVVYAERAVPADRRTPVDQDSAFADLNYAIYLGPRASAAALATTDVDPDTLPLDGPVVRRTIPFGDTVLTLVASPQRHLGSSLSQQLPWIIALAGILLTGAAALIARQLVRSRTHAESHTETITALYRRVDTMYGEQRALFVRLQRALLPQVNPDIPGLEIASQYVAGAEGIDIGGDWYSIIGIGDDEFAFVVGDVSGRGVDAVAVMAHARFTLRAYLIDGQSPQSALEKCSHQFDISVDGHITTAIVGIGNWRTGEITVANAGHPLPLMLTDDGSEFVSIPAGPPLGTGPATYASTTFTLAPGSTLIAYTDGLIERRTENIDVGMRRLADAVERVAPKPLDDIIAHVLDTLRTKDASDDIAVLALRRVSS